MKIELGVGTTFLKLYFLVIDILKFNIVFTVFDIKILYVGNM